MKLATLPYWPQTVTYACGIYPHSMIRPKHKSLSNEDKLIQIYTNRFNLRNNKEIWLYDKEYSFAEISVFVSKYPSYL
jgi:hypothetical protein